MSVNPQEEQLRNMTAVTEMINLAIKDTNDKSKKKALVEKKKEYQSRIDDLVEKMI